MIEVNALTKRFGSFTALSELSFKVEKSSVYGLVGYNGAGKTTLLKTLAGVYKADEGVVNICGENVYDNAKIKQKIFYVPDELYFASNASMDKMAKFYDGYYENFSFNTYEKLAGVFGLDTKKKINGFSKGMQRQAELVLGLATRPEVLLLDESFDGLDPQKRALVKNMVLEYLAEKEISVVISSHNLHELGDMCDHIGLINGQKLALDCSVDEMSQSRCKYRLAFTAEKSEEDFKGINMRHFKRDGKLVTFTVTGNIDEAEEKIKSLSPVLMESFPLSLEEIFLDEMEGTEYDFSQIFD